MNLVNGFRVVKTQELPEIKTKALFYTHVKTGAELLWLKNGDENKVFGISFRTPPSDSTGLPHIIEHSVLCGSRKYPTKKPLSEYQKGSPRTFLKATTFRDKTCYAFGSKNFRDFYNLMNLSLDAVFHPILSPFTFQQEGWHHELEKVRAPLLTNGVVLNEMKGLYSSPDKLVNEYSLRSIFPDNSYRFDPGGEPLQIPNLTFEQFINFHKRYYQPSNSKIFIYGDCSLKESLAVVNGYLKDFNMVKVNSSISLQKRFKHPRHIIKSFPTDKNNFRKGMITLNWLLPETNQSDLRIALSILSRILINMVGSPLRKALIDSSLGEDIIGRGINSELKQMFFSVGLKGVAPEQAENMCNLVFETLKRLHREGIDTGMVNAAIHSIEFWSRLNTTGYPWGFFYMLKVMNTWIHDGDPLSQIAFESTLNAIKPSTADKNRFFEDLIEKYFIDNPHMTCLILKPDVSFLEKEKDAEGKRLAKIKGRLSSADIQVLIDNTMELKTYQERKDSDEALSTTPLLRLEDLNKNNTIIPIEIAEEMGTTILYHNIVTNGIVYLDLGFDLHKLPHKYLSYVQLFGRSLLEMGTQKEDYIVLSQKINSKIGGLGSFPQVSNVKKRDESAAWLFIKGIALSNQVKDMMDILREIFLNVNLDNKKRFKQLVLEEKAKLEQIILFSGSTIINSRLCAHYSEADRVSDDIMGLSYLFFLRRLITEIDHNWQSVLNDLSDIYHILLNRNAMLINVTGDYKSWASCFSLIKEFIASLPARNTQTIKWSLKTFPEFEGFTIPAQVNYIGKGVNLNRIGYNFNGSIHVICRFLNSAWFWERIRVQGGAYGGRCFFDYLSGTFTMLSYRDPHIKKTIDTFNNTATFLRKTDLTDDELTKEIIGKIGEIDNYKLPEIQGHESMLQYIKMETDADLQRIRDDVFTTSKKDFMGFVEAMETLKNNGIVKIFGSNKAIGDIDNSKPGWLNITNVF